MDAILFKRRYDTARLCAELEAAVAAASWIAKPEKGKYFKWSAIPLHTLHGSMSPEAVDVHVSEWLAQECAPTSVGAACPYVRELLEGFEAPKLRVRFMKLEVGGHIGRHRDRLYGWELPILRLHIPVTTHAGVEFLLEDRRIDLRPGELWYLNTSKDHEVFNHGPTERVHLVIDLVNGPGIRQQLGPETWERGS
jgi:hypothetical protein